MCACLWRCILSRGDCRRQPDGYRIILQHCTLSSVILLFLLPAPTLSSTLPCCLAASQQNYHSKTHTYTHDSAAHRSTTCKYIMHLLCMKNTACTDWCWGGGGTTKVLEKDLVSHRCKLQNQKAAPCSPCSKSTSTHARTCAHTHMLTPHSSTSSAHVPYAKATVHTCAGTRWPMVTRKRMASASVLHLVLLLLRRCKGSRV